MNPLAKEEYEAEKARLEELATQRADLEASLEELETLRAELTETVERRFAETFSSVAANFEDVAATLFPGGTGRLRLTEADEEGESAGIEIELRPAGKKITRLSLLSGGEKSLGAISFLFALFLARPCPFYLLDEVEAALDDTNIGRFVELLRRYAERGAVRRHHAPEADDGGGGRALRRDDGRRGRVADRLAAPAAGSGGRGLVERVLRGEPLRRLEQPRVDQPLAHVVLVGVLEPDEQVRRRGLEVRREAVDLGVRVDDQRALLAVAARPHRALVAAQAGERLAAHGEGRPAPRRPLLDLRQRQCERPHVVPADHVLRLTFAAVPRTWGELLGDDPAGTDETPEEQQGFFGRLRDSLGRSRRALTEQIAVAAFDPEDDAAWERLEEALITADVGVPATAELVQRLEARGELGDLGEALAEEIAAMLGEPATLNMTPSPTVILVVGVNGTGKTTTIGKLASKLREHGLSVILGAADTFRAAAEEQLEIWATRAEADFVGSVRGADPAAVAFDAVEAAQARGRDVVIVDTAGRLHTQANLMEELAKVRRVIAGKLDGAPHETLLVVDATTGQNGLQQARLFGEAVEVTGVALTKLDGSAKGGIAVAIAHELGLPVKLVGVGEGLDDLRPFDPGDFARALVSG